MPSSVRATEKPSAEILSTPMAAERCGVSRRTMQRWLKSRALPSFTTRGGHRRILSTDLDAFLAQRGCPVVDGPADCPRIVVVDDDPDYTTIVERLLQTLVPEAEVSTATDGFAAGLMIGSLHPHLVLLDLLMPGVDGIEVCRRLRRDPATAGTRIVVVSGALTEERRAVLKDLGVEEIWSKPLSIERMQRLLADLGLVRSRAGRRAG